MVASGQQRAGGPAPLRLTRRGWVVLLMLVVITASLVGALLATASRAVVPVRMVPVSQFETFWKVSPCAPGERLGTGRVEWQDTPFRRAVELAPACPAA